MEKIEDVRDRLLSNPPDLPSWIYFDPGSTPSVVAALDYWLEAASKKTVKGILKYHEYKSPAALRDSVSGMTGLTPVFKELVQATRSRIEQQVQDFLDTMSDADLQTKPICPPGVPMPEAREMIKMSMTEDFMNEQGLEGRDVLEKEIDWYKEMNCFYPPKELEARHPGLVALKKQVMKQEARGERPNPDKQLVYVVRNLLSHSLHSMSLGSRAPSCLRPFSGYIQADKEYRETWKANITYFVSPSLACGVSRRSRVTASRKCILTRSSPHLSRRSALRTPLRKTMIRTTTMVIPSCPGISFRPSKPSKRATIRSTLGWTVRSWSRIEYHMDTFREYSKPLPKPLWRYPPRH